jgi:SsrA-binding protein
MKQKEGKAKPIVNRRARFEYEVLDTVEAGLVLSGPEVKSLRLGRAQLKDSYATIHEGEAYLVNTHISAYQFARNEGYEPTRRRKLLLRKRQIESLQGQLQRKGMSLVPLKIYQKEGRFKVELGLVRGKKEYEKREVIKRRDIRREVERELRKGKYRG